MFASNRREKLENPWRGANDEVGQRAIAKSGNEAALSQTSIISLVQRRRGATIA